MFARKTVFSMVMLTMAACAREGVSVSPHVTGSSSIVTTEDGSLVLVASTEAGAVIVFDSDKRELDRLELGLEPYRIARAGDLLLVTLRGQGELAVIERREGTLEVKQRLRVGAMPTSVVVSPDQNFAYLATLDGVLELELDTLELARRWTIADQPSWLAIDPQGLSLFVASAANGRLTHIALEDGVARALELPDFVFGGYEPFAKLLTGDPTITAGGDRLLLPALYADNETPLRDVIEEQGTGVLSAVPRALPALISIPLDERARPIEERAAALSAYPYGWSGPRELTHRAIGGRIASVVASPFANQAVVSYDGSDAVIALPLFDAPVSLAASGLSGGGGPAPAPGTYGSSGTLSIPGRRPGITTNLTQPWGGLAIRAGAGPRGVVFDARGWMWIDARVEGSISRVDATLMAETSHDDETIRARAAWLLQASLPVEIERRESDQVKRGRELFYLGTRGGVAMSLSEPSCATCHLDRASDLIEWTLASGGTGIALELQRMSDDIDLIRPWTAVGTGEPLPDEDLRSLAAFIAASR